MTLTNRVLKTPGRKGQASSGRTQPLSLFRPKDGRFVQPGVFNTRRETMSRLNLYFHIVWATKHRQPFLTPEKETAVYRCAMKLIEEMSYTVLAINGMPDHVHLLIQSGPQIDLSVLMKKVKGVTSALINGMTNHTGTFRWQEGYFAATVTPAHLSKVQAYVQNQKQHHVDGTIHALWEQTGETAGPH